MLESLFQEVVHWAATDPRVQAVGLVGSHARREARPDSDVDLVILTDDPGRVLRSSSWPSLFGVVGSDSLEDYGKLVSRRVLYASGLDVEFGVSTPEWASDPDDATLVVARDGLRVLFDPKGLLQSLLARLGVPRGPVSDEIAQ